MVIAVVGHRDLFEEDENEIKQSIKSILQKQQESFPNSRLLVLTALAEGADRIGAEAAKELGVPYFAVLPFEAAVYKETSPDQSSKSKFDELIGAAAKVITLPLVAGNTLAVLCDRKNAEARQKQYIALAEFLVSMSQIVIAARDKSAIASPGGTHFTCNLKLGRIEPGATLETRTFQYRSTPYSSGLGPVVEVLVRRRQTGITKPTGISPNSEYPDGTCWRDFEDSYRLQDRFNEDIAKAQANEAMCNDRAKSATSLTENLQVVGESPGMQWVRSMFSWADSLAIRHANLSSLLWLVVFELLVVAGLAFCLMHGVSWLHYNGGLESTYYLAILIATVAGFFEIITKRRQRHEDYRALAEALRVQFFWYAAGIRELAADHFLNKRRGETLWVRDAMTECGLYEALTSNDGASERDDNSLDEARLALMKTWISSQSAYYRDRIGSYTRTIRILKLLGSSLLLIGFILPLAGWIAWWKFPPLFHSSFIDPVLGVVPPLAIIWAAICFNYLELRGLVQLRRQYERMAGIYTDAQRDLERITSIPTDLTNTAAQATNMRRVVRRLGIEALAENGEWLTVHRERRLKPTLAAAG